MPDLERTQADASLDATATPAGVRRDPAAPCAWCGHPLPEPPCPRCAGRLFRAPGAEAMTQRPRRGFFAFDLLRGFAGFFEGLALLFNRPEFAGKLRGPVIANLFSTLTLGAILFVGFRAMFAPVEGEGDLLGVFTTSLALLLTCISLFLFLPPLLELITSPFLDDLVDIVEKAMGGPKLTPVRRHLWANIRDSSHASAQLLLLAGAGWIVTLVLSMVAIGIPLGILVAAFLNALTWFELPFFRRGYTLRDRIAVLRHNWALATGFGLGVQLGMLIPIFNVFLLAPAAAVGASVLYLRMEKAPPPRKPGRPTPVTDGPTSP